MLALGGDAEGAGLPEVEEIRQRADVIAVGGALGVVGGEGFHVLHKVPDGGGGVEEFHPREVFCGGELWRGQVYILICEDYTGGGGCLFHDC